MMNKLSQELVDCISSYLAHDDLKNTLFVSRPFQYAAEQYSGAFERFMLNNSNVESFINLYNLRRFRYLRYVHFTTILSALEDAGEDAEDAAPCRESAEDLQLIDDEFTRQINLLFSSLQTVEQSSLESPGNIHLLIYSPTRAVNLEGICLHHNFVSWRVHLISPEKLPSIRSVRQLTIRNAEDPLFAGIPDPPLRKLDLRILLDLSNKFPNLEFLQCLLGGDEWYNSFSNVGLRHIARDCAGPRRDSRHDFGNALQAPQSLSHIELDFLHPLSIVDNLDQRRALPNLTKPSMYDPFSNRLRLLSHQLRSMKLRLVADTTLFWPNKSNTGSPAWPNLESVHVMFHISAPSGSWYFDGLPGIGATEGFEVTADSYPPLSPTEDEILDDECDDGTADESDGEYQIDIVQFRVNPNNEVLVPFLAAFARAAASMPSLKDAVLWTPLTFKVNHIQDQYDNFDSNALSRFFYGDLAWGLAYTKPGVEAFDPQTGEDFSKSRQLWWRVGKWRPDPELRGLFQKIGREHQVDLIEYWNSARSGEGLDSRQYFEERGYFKDLPEA